MYFHNFCKFPQKYMMKILLMGVLPSNNSGKSIINLGSLSKIFEL